MRWMLCGERTLGALSAVALFAAAERASADIIQVPGDYGSIQAAIVAASDGDVILVGTGSYNETINLLGKAITVRSVHGADVTIVDGSGPVPFDISLVTFSSGEGPDTVFEGFTISGGFAPQGGGMLITGSSPTILDCTFSGNTSAQGGGAVMIFDFSNPLFSNCAFIQNTAALGGGGVLSAGSSSPVFIDCHFADNSGENGGGFYCAGTFSSAEVTNCTFENNVAMLGGGGMNIYRAQATIKNSVFEGNFAKGAGGLMHAGADGNATIENCVIANNVSSGNGGGVLIFNCAATISNCLIANNEAAELGGGVMVAYNVSLGMTNCTVAANLATFGGGLACDDWFERMPSEVDVTNSVFWNEGEEITIRDASTVAIAFSDIEGGYPGTGNIDADPQFVDPANGDLHPLPGSPCIDAGNNTAVPDGVTTDLDGNPRFSDDPDTPDCQQAPGTCGDPPVVDMGAYEFQIPCPGDINGDGAVDVNDFIQILVAWGPCPGCPADINGDGVVNVQDFLALLARWGPCP
ncbi:MAG: GC-type dockerin domain-anchored protein [Planctomycetota bacterium]